MKCQECGSNLWTVNTYPVQGATVRRKACVDCDYRTTLYEIKSDRYQQMIAAERRLAQITKAIERTFKKALPKEPAPPKPKPKKPRKPVTSQKKEIKLTKKALELIDKYEKRSI